MHHLSRPIHHFMDLCEEEQIEDKLANYIRQHKATFLN